MSSAKSEIPIGQSLLIKHVGERPLGCTGRMQSQLPCRSLQKSGLHLGPDPGSLEGGEGVSSAEEYGCGADEGTETRMRSEPAVQLRVCVCFLLRVRCFQHFFCVYVCQVLSITALMSASY